MSGSPKYSRAELDRQRQAKLESDRRRKAEQEAHRRQEAEERERQRQLEAERKRIAAQLQTLLTQINQQSDLIYAGDRQGLEQKGQSLQQQIQAAILPDKLSNLTTEIQQLQRVWEEAKHQKWHAEQEKLRQQELDRQKLALEDCDRRLAERLADAQKFDGSGLRFVQQSLAQVKDLITQGHPDTMRPSLKDCQLAIAAYLDKVQALKQTWLAEKAQAEQELAQLQTAIAGLQADPVVML